MSTGSPNISLPPAPEDDYLFYAEKILMSFNCRDDGDNSCTYSFKEVRFSPDNLIEFKEIIKKENSYFKKHPTDHTKFIFYHLIAIEERCKPYLFSDIDVKELLSATKISSAFEEAVRKILQTVHLFLFCYVFCFCFSLELFFNVCS
eukprot:TRINITY_DN5808_c0_g1_i3.p1 TRINITY_DN5808_c0_g1~~TRINITY_DN5808_c0_g1_i3.p1  ORF type:complete len:147 (+),score=13.55 TRINITY_DN5808_c0_g1_i3:32-472(+)